MRDMDMAETLPNTPAVSYGVKTVKHLARATKARPGPSPMYQQSKDGIREYFLANVDPLVADCVTHLLFQKPDDVVGTLIGYLTLRKELGAAAIAQPPTAPPAAGKPKTSHKVFLATQISPVLSYVMNKIAHARPVELIDFLIAELKAMPKVVPPRKKAGKTRPLTAGPKGGKGPAFALDATSRPKTAPPKRDSQDEEGEQGAAADADAGAGAGVVAAAVESRTYKEKDGVEAQKNNGVKWYAGHVLTAEQEEGVLTGYYTIKYCSGEAEEHVAGARLRPWQAGADGCQDVEIQYRGGSKFYAATITATTQEGDARFFTATYTDGRSETGVSESRVRSRSTGLGVLEVGESVESQYRRGRKWFAATITAVGSDGKNVDVLYADGDMEAGVATSRVRSLESGAPVSTAVVKNLRPGSRVECSMTAEGGVISGWRIGTIASVNADGSYEVTMDAGDSDHQVLDERLRVLEGFAPVEVRYHRGAKWYPAVVTSDNGDGTFDVDYDDGDSESRMPAKYIRSKGVLMTGSGEDDVAGSPAKKATAADAAAAFEKVGSPVKARYKGGRKWFEGNVSGVNRDGTFNIRYADQDTEEYVPKRMIKYNESGTALDEQSFDDQSFDDSVGSSDTLPIGVDLNRKYSLGQRVEAQFARKPKFYKGTVTKVLPNDRYAISYVDGDKEASVHVRFMRFDPRLIACAGDTARVIVAGLMEKYKPVVVEKPKPRVVAVAVLGLDGAGKTSFLNALQGDPGARVRPTVGFKPLSMALNESLQIKFYDIGGGKKIRGIWDKYYHDVHACIYMVDASDASRNDEAVEVFKNTMGDGGLGGKPLCIVCNKQDVNGAASPADVAALLGVSETKSVVIKGAVSNVTHASVETAVEWVLENVQARYEELNGRVEKEVEKRKKEELMRKLARERKVLRNKVASAFPSLVTNADLMPLGFTAESEPEDCFTEEEGNTFLASEVGLEELPPAARQVCALVGQQRLALTIIGGLFSPVSKKKEPMSWDEILDLIQGVRDELGIAKPKTSVALRA